jgi:hypothetical protein
MTTFSFLTMTTILLAVFVTTVLHLPGWLQRLLLRLPAWVQALAIHFLYGSWLGGVTGHLIGGALAVCWFFVAKYWLQPRILHAREEQTRPKRALRTPRSPDDNRAAINARLRALQRHLSEN